MTTRQTTIRFPKKTDEQLDNLAQLFGDKTKAVVVAVDRLYCDEAQGKEWDYLPTEPEGWSLVADMHSSQLHFLRQAIGLRELEIMASRLNKAGFGTRLGRDDIRFNMILVYAPAGSEPDVTNEWATVEEAQRLLDTVRNLPATEAFARWRTKIKPLAKEIYTENDAKRDIQAERAELRRRHEAGEITSEQLGQFWADSRQFMEFAER